MSFGAVLRAAAAVSMAGPAAQQPVALPGSLCGGDTPAGIHHAAAAPARRPEDRDRRILPSHAPATLGSEQVRQTTSLL